MAIIYTYPQKSTLSLSDSVLITDNESVDPSKRTKQATVQALKNAIAPTTLSLTTTGASGAAATLTNSVLNIPTPVIPAVPFTSLTTTGASGTAATLTSGVLDIPTPVIPTATFTSLATVGTSGVATLTSGVLNIPNYSTEPSAPANSIQFNSGSSFGGDSGFTFTNTAGVPKLTIGNTGSDVSGIIEIQSDENGAELKIGGGSQTHYTSIKGSDSDTASYGIILPPAGPGSNNKILESTSAGILSWINTPSSVSYSAGDGIDLTGTTFSTDLKANGGLVIESTELAVDLSASAITGTLAVGDGGTGVTLATDYDVLVGRSGIWNPSRSVTSGIQLPVGTTANRPAASSSVNGLIRYNSTLGTIEAVVAGAWINVTPP